jgi:hypothetical protein
MGGENERRGTSRQGRDGRSTDKIDFAALTGRHYGRHTSNTVTTSLTIKKITGFRSGEPCLVSESQIGRGPVRSGPRSMLLERSGETTPIGLRCIVFTKAKKVNSSGFIRIT